MWPWGHLALGYLLYSPVVRLIRGRAPTSAEVVALVFGTQLPDLVDKPLSWVFHVTPQGYSVAHSVFVAVPVGLLALAIAARRDRTAVGAAFTVGYWSHLFGDVLFAVGLGQRYTVERLLWPVVTLPEYSSNPMATERILSYLVDWVAHLLATESVLLPLLYLGPLAAAGLLWLVDGAPGIPRPDRDR